MSWIPLLKPDVIVNGTIFKLTPAQIREYGLKGLILDVDETLLPASSSQISPELKAWVDALRPQVKLWLVSNNPNLSRIQHIAAELDLPFYLGAGKPSRRKLRQAMESMNLRAEELGIIGDRLLTDVLAGNRLGIFTILVDPIFVSEATGSLLAQRSFWIRRLELWISGFLGINSSPR